MWDLIVSDPDHCFFFSPQCRTPYDVEKEDKYCPLGHDKFIKKDNLMFT